MTQPLPHESEQPTMSGKIIYDAVEVPPEQLHPEGERNPASASATFRAIGKSKAGVLMILFFATGFLGIPLLFYSSRFGTIERIFWSIVVTIYTCALIAVAVWVLVWAWGNVQAALWP